MAATPKRNNRPNKRKKREDSFSENVPPNLRQNLREEFIREYQVEDKTNMGRFLQQWQLKIGTRRPSDETVRNFMYKEERNSFEYWLVDGCCQLLLKCTFREWKERQNHAKINTQDGNIPPTPSSGDAGETVATQNSLPISVDKGAITNTPQNSLFIPHTLSRTFPGEATLTHTYHNLPTPNYTECIGREKEIAQLLELLSPHNPAYRISVEGMGGVGKTTLVLEVAYRCLNANCRGIGAIEAIVFTSAQPQRLANNRILRRPQRERTTSDILEAIARTLKCNITDVTTLEELLKRVSNSLERHRTLLIVDNLETIEDLEDTLSLLYELPPTVKVVVTSREQAQLDFSIHLKSLSQADGLSLIQHQAKEKKVSLSDAQSEEIYKRIGGIPAAIVSIIGQLRAYRPLDLVLSQLNQATGDITRFCLESSVQLVRGEPCHYLLMALAMFRKPALIDVLIQVALPEAEPFTIAESFARLQQLSLIIDTGTNQEGVEKRYDMLPLTRGYVLTELESQYPDFEREARERWISWYLRFSQEHGAKDEKEWNEYRQLESEWENLQDAIQWCIDNNRYEEFLQFWRNVRSYSHAQGYYLRDRLIYWDTRLNWTNWLTLAAQQREDWSTAAEVMFDRGWTLTLMGGKRLEEAKTLFAQAWKLRQHKDLTFQIDLAIHIAYVRLYQRQFHKARRWLTLSQQMLQQSERSSLTATRFSIHILYYQGEICFRTGNFASAKPYYQQARQQAEAIEWHRAVSLAQNWLADIEIEEGNLDEAGRLLEEGLRVAQKNNDKCRTAFCKRSMVLLEKAQGNSAEARRWAESAMEEFNSLGMIAKAEEIRSWLQDLGTDRWA